MDSAAQCPECGARWAAGVTCQDHFHQMLAWEIERPELGEVHHLMVPSFYLQHPTLYSPEGLIFSLRLLRDFVERGLTPLDVRRRNRDALDSGRRRFKITATPAAHGAYDRAVKWTMTAADVTAAGADAYRESVRRWAKAILDDLRASGTLPEA